MERIKPDWGSFTLMGNQRQRNIEERWRYQVRDLRNAILERNLKAPMARVIGRNPVYTDPDLDIIEAAMDECDREAIAMFIYRLLEERNQ